MFTEIGRAGRSAEGMACKRSPPQRCHRVASCFSPAQITEIGWIILYRPTLTMPTLDAPCKLLYRNLCFTKP